MGPQSKGQLAVGEKLRVGGSRAYFRGREVRLAFTEKKLLTLSPGGREAASQANTGWECSGGPEERIARHV